MERRGKTKSRNMCKGAVGKDNGVEGGLNVEGKGWVGRGEQWGKMGMAVIEQQ